jgi:site-specific recombinase XerD
MERQPKLLDQVRHAVRLRHYSFSTEKAYVQWIRRFILASGKRHPRDLGAPEVERFLTELAVREHVSPSTQNQALSAILFLYKHVLGMNLEWLSNVVRAKRDRKIPVVFTQKEARQVIAHLADKYWLMGSLMYGAGLRVMETLRLRIKDLYAIFWPVFAQSARNDSSPLSVSTCLKSACRVAGGTVATSDPINAACLT